MKKILSVLSVLFFITLTSYAGILDAFANKPVIPLYFNENADAKAGYYGEININFDDDVMALSDIDTMLKNITGKINIASKPLLRFRIKPVGTRGIVLEIVEKPILSTRYEVKITTKDLKSVNGGKVNLQINNVPLKGDTVYLETPRLRVNSFFSTSEWPDSPKIISFNMPVTIDELTRKVKLDPEGLSFNVPFTVEYRVVTNKVIGKDKKTKIVIERRNNEFTLRPKGEVKWKNYSVKVPASLLPKDGNLPMQDNFTSGYRTYQPFHCAISSSTSDKDGFRYFPDSTIYFSFNNPLSNTANIKKLVTPSPKPANWNVTSDGNTISATGDFASEKPFSFVLSKNITDIYGQKAPETDFSVDVEHYLSLFGAPSGFMVMENYIPRVLPFKLRNVDQVSLRYKSIENVNDAVAYLNLSEKDIEDTLTEITIPIKWSWDKIFNYRLDLSKYNKTGHGLFAYYITPDTKNPAGKDYNGTYSYYEKKGVILFTSMGLTVKDSPFEIAVIARSLSNNQPVANAKVSIYQDSIVSLGKTDNDGVFRFPADRSWKWIIVENGADFAITRNPANQRYNSDDEDYYYGGYSEYTYYNNPMLYRGSENLKIGNRYYYKKPELMVFSDRFLYKPGESADFKGILRYRNRDEWSVIRNTGPDQAELNYEVINSRGEVMDTGKLTPDELGGFHFKQAIPQDAPTGYYSVHVFSESNIIDVNSTFRVQEFRPARAEMRIIPSSPFYVWGDKLQADIIGWYLFGAPIIKPIEYSVSFQPKSYNSKLYPTFSFYNSYYSYYDENGDYYSDYGNSDNSSSLLSGTMDPDDNGRVHLNLDLIKNNRGDGTITISGKTKLEDDSVVFGAKSGIDVLLPIHAGIKIPQFFYKTGDNIPVGLIAIDQNEKITSGYPCKLDIVRSEWVSYEKAGVNGRLQWEWKEIKTNMLSTNIDLGRQDIPFKTDIPGYYSAVLTRKDNPKQTINRYFYVIGSGYIGWQMNNDNRVDVTPDKTEYQVGDTAQILVKNPFKNATAMVTLEREKVHDIFQVESTNSMLVIPVKITEACIPNMYISVMLFTGRSGYAASLPEDFDPEKPRFLIGYTQLRVIPKEKKLQIVTTSDQPTYMPRDKVAVDFKVMDSAGSPADAELTISVADKGVLNLVNYQLPDPIQFFYKPRALAVHTTETRNFIYGQRYLAEKGEVIGGDGGFASMGMILPRMDIRYSAFYSAKIMTTNGTASINFTLPDNLTSFKVMAVAQNSKSQFGYGDSEFNVKKPLMVLSLVPQAARTGDSFMAGALIYNYTGSNQNIQVQLKADDGFAITGNPVWNTNINLKNSGSQEVLVPVKVTGGTGTSGKFTVKAVAGDASDGIVETVPIFVPQIYETTATYNMVSNQQLTWTNMIVLTTNIIPEWSSVKLKVSPTAFSELKGNLDYLVEYPYGCLEQKSSKIFPLIIGEDVILKYGLLEFKTKADLRKTVQDILDEFGNYATSDGFSYWTDDKQTSAYITAYASMVMTIAKSKGYKVDEALYQKSVKWCRDYADGRGYFEWWTLTSKWYRNLVTSIGIYTAYLQGYENPNTLQNVYQSVKRNNSDMTTAYAYLLKTAGNYKDFNGRKEMMNEIRNLFAGRQRTETQTVYFEDKTDWGWFYYDNVISTSIILQSILESGIDWPDAYKSIMYLSRAKKAGSWYNTHENAMVFWAFDTYLEKFEKQEPNFKAEASIKAKKILSVFFQNRNDQEPPAINSFNAQDKGNIPVIFKKDGPGIFYYYMNYRYVLKKMPLKRDMGFSIEKKYLDYDTGDEITNSIFVRGQKYIIQINVNTPKERYFAVLDDQLPAGLEAVNLDFATADNPKKVDESGHNYWGDFNHQEKYRDRIIFTSQYLAPGPHSIQYVVQAVTPGNFHTPMVRAEEMYAPEVFGTLYQPDIKVLLPKN